MLSGNYKFYYLFYLVFFCSCYISCVTTTKENTELTRTEIKELIDVEVKQYLDNTYVGYKYEIYDFPLTFMDTLRVIDFLKYKKLKKVLYPPNLDSFLKPSYSDSSWNRYNVDNISFTSNELRPLKGMRTIGLTMPYFYEDYYILQEIQMFRNQGCIVLGYNTLYYKQNGQNWELIFLDKNE